MYACMYVCVFLLVCRVGSESSDKLAEEENL